MHLIGAELDSIRIAEDRALFRDTLIANHIPVPYGGAAGSEQEATILAARMRYPLLVRASFALGGSGASWVEQPEDLREAV